MSDKKPFYRSCYNHRYPQIFNCEVGSPLPHALLVLILLNYCYFPVVYKNAVGNPNTVARTKRSCGQKRIVYPKGLGTLSRGKTEAISISSIILTISHFDFSSPTERRVDL